MNRAQLIAIRLTKNAVLSSINTTQNDLDKLIENNAKGAAVRSRERWTEYGEKNTKYFLGLVKRNKDKKSIKSLKNPQGILITNQANILKELNSFYESLYHDNEQYNEDQSYDFIQSMSLPTINETPKTQSDTPITEHECLQAIFQLANNRSPGPDGFAVEFYKVFWEDIKRPCMECLKYSISTKQLFPSQYEGIITLLPKPGKDRFFAANFRPITY